MPAPGAHLPPGQGSLTHRCHSHTCCLPANGTCNSQTCPQWPGAPGRCQSCPCGWAGRGVNSGPGADPAVSLPPGAVCHSGDSQVLSPALLSESSSQDSPYILPPCTLGAPSGPGPLPPWPAHSLKGLSFPFVQRRGWTRWPLSPCWGLGIRMGPGWGRWQGRNQSPAHTPHPGPSLTRAPGPGRNCPRDSARPATSAFPWNTGEVHRHQAHQIHLYMQGTLASICH